MDKKVIVVTGASSGFGYYLCIELANKGNIVYGLARRIEKLKELEKYNVNVMQLDVTKYDDAKVVIDTILEKEKRIDVLVNNAGYGEYGPIECVKMEDAKYQLDVNVFSYANMAKLVIPSMRENKSGRIVNVSSVAGREVLYLSGWYHISKYAVEALSDALRMEVKDFGIDVAIIEPGPFKTNWGLIARQRLIDSTKDTPYEKYSLRLANTYSNIFSESNKSALDPKKVSKKMAKVCMKKRVKPRYVVGRYMKLMLFGMRILPTKLRDRLVVRILRGKVK